jgi:hypothetical protein
LLSMVGGGELAGQAAADQLAGQAAAALKRHR